MGSGTGKVVINAYKKRNVHKSIGIEKEDKFYRLAKNKARAELPEAIIGETVDFFYGDYAAKTKDGYIFDVSNATVIYNSLAPSGKSSFYDVQFKEKSGVKIIKKDLPLVGYKPISVSREDPNSLFFQMLTPLKQYRSHSKKEWASYVMGRDAEIKDVFKYYNQLWERNNNKKIPDSIKLQLENLVKEFLPEK
ncbi:MAG: hypothetical protein R3327_06170 [Nitrosopumilaceae archaeon]|nr:hypothetical protein [Nitrosopumilaceae archaeon]